MAKWLRNRTAKKRIEPKGVEAESGAGAKTPKEQEAEFRMDGVKQRHDSTAIPSATVSCIAAIWSSLAGLFSSASSPMA